MRIKKLENHVGVLDEEGQRHEANINKLTADQEEQGRRVKYLEE